VQGLLALIPVPLPAWIRVESDGPVLAVTAALGVGTALLFALAPIAAGWRIDLARALRDGTRGSTRSPIRASLVVGEIALSVLLLVSAGLLMRTFIELRQRHPGFQPEGVVAARVVLWAPGSRQSSAAVLAGIHDRVLGALETLPGVRSAAVTNYLPYTGTTVERIQADIFIRGRAEQDTKTLAPISGSDVSPDYFATMRIPLIMRESMTLCAIGMGIGTLTALALGRIVESLLFGVTAHDPVTYTTVLAVLIATVGLASWLPAARASRVSPTEALRAE
jgi:hypothetical protein